MIPLNMICLDCSNLNDNLLHLVDGLRLYIVDYFVNENRTHNRGFEKIFFFLSIMHLKHKFFSLIKTLFFALGKFCFDVS